jgi:hypothetical protein
MVEMIRVVTADVNPNQCKLTDPLRFILQVEASSDMKIVATTSLILDVAYVCVSSSIYESVCVDQSRNS